MLRLRQQDTFGMSIFVGSPIYYWNAGKSGYLLNNVKERGFPQALLWFNNPNSYNTTISGVWSPDSI